MLLLLHAVNSKQWQCTLNNMQLGYICNVSGIFCNVHVRRSHTAQKIYHRCFTSYFCSSTTQYTADQDRFQQNLVNRNSITLQGAIQPGLKLPIYKPKSETWICFANLPCTQKLSQKLPQPVKQAILFRANLITYTTSASNCLLCCF